MTSFPKPMIFETKKKDLNFALSKLVFKCIFSHCFLSQHYNGLRQANMPE